ncbi:MAG: alpha/beta hydrolase [Rhodocyclaceae bacterium]|nr:alpha/beta hydrolase [Rhodocyclaceae bacterium]
MQSLKSRLLYFVVKRQLAKLRALNLPLPEFRKAREAAAEKLFKLPANVKLEETRSAGCHAEWLRPDNAATDGVVLYLHGGAYVGGSCITHRALAGRLAAAAGRATLIIDYRLAPEHPFPAALGDAVATYAELLAAGSSRIAVAGDSAGAGLALALVQRLRETRTQMPVALALMSPWTDLALTSETHQTKARVDPYFPTPERLAVSAAAYAGSTPLTHPMVSPHYADVSGFPPMLIHVGEHETLLNDSLWLAQRVQAAGGTVEIKVWPGMWHVWQALGGKMREADDSIAELGDFVKRRFDALPS